MSLSSLLDAPVPGAVVTRRNLAPRLAGLSLLVALTLPSPLLPGQPTAAAGSRRQDSQAERDARGRPAEITEADRRFRFAATRTPTPPVIDGDLGDAVWERAERLDRFVQATPDEGEPISEPTEVRVLYDDDAVYIAARNHDSQPERIVTTVLRRDQAHGDNDAFMVTLDTYHDHRNGFYFETNAEGAKFDAQIIGEGGSGPGGSAGFNPDWDAVWEARSRIVEDGWTVEMAIPFWSLRYEADRTGAWGVNFRRTIRRKSETAYWAPVPRQYDGTRLSMSGLMTGMDEIGRARNLQFKPYLIGAVNQEPAGPVVDGRFEHDSDALGDIGLDVKWGPTPNLTLDVTANPDFSQVEADDEQINLTRFPLFFPEKREFFLENAGLFQFGSGGGPRSTRVVGFHSRRIGISEDNQEVPLYGGARLTGKVGAWSLGLVSMQSQDTVGLPSSNYAVVRLRRDLGNRSNVGVLVTNRQADADDYNRELGVDGRWAIDDQTTVDAWWMRTRTPGLEGEEWAGRGGLDWGTPEWQVQGSATQIGDHFNPELGFVDRTGIRTWDGSVHWTPYFPEVGWLRNLSPHVNAVYTTDTDSRLLSRFVHLDWDLFLRRGDKLSVAHNRTFEQLDLPFEIAPGVVVPPGAYHNDEIHLELVSDASRPVSASLNLTDGTFWSGERREIRLDSGFRAGARFSAEVSWARNDVELPQGAFVTDLVRTRLGLDLSTRLSLAGLIQYNSSTEQLLTNLRLNFIHTPGADLFVVYNERRLPEDSALLDRAVIVKVTHLLRF